MPRTRALLMVCVTMLGYAPVLAQVPDINANIRKEEAENSQIMRTMHFLTDIEESCDRNCGCDISACDARRIVAAVQQRDYAAASTEARHSCPGGNSGASTADE